MADGLRSKVGMAGRRETSGAPPVLSTLCDASFCVRTRGSFQSRGQGTHLRVPNPDSEVQPL